MRRYIFDAPDIPLKFAMGRQIHRHIYRWAEGPGIEAL
jgi:hypothetical protein